MPTPGFLAMNYYTKVKSIREIPAGAKLARLGSLLFLFLFVLTANACGPTSDELINDNAKEDTWLQSGLWESVWKTSPSDLDLDGRKSLFAEIQTLADGCSNTIFKKYMAADPTLARSLEKSYPILRGYDLAFQRVLDGVVNDKVADGEVAVWHLYNMGYVIKTSSGTFAIDIYHRRAEELAPYIDFYAITHKHTDHKSEELAQKMTALGKPVLANFAIDGCSQNYISDEVQDYEIGDFKIHTFITNHNNSSTNVPITVFKIDLGAKAGHCILMHSGDSNFRPEQFSTVQGDKVDIYIPRYAQTEVGENAVIGKVITPSYTLLSHILELYHESVANSRWPLEYGLQRAARLDCQNSYMPFWGDKMVWKNNELK